MNLRQIMMKQAADVLRLTQSVRATKAMISARRAVVNNDLQRGRLQLSDVQNYLAILNEVEQKLNDGSLEKIL